MITEQFITDLIHFLYGLWPLGLQLAVLAVIIGLWFGKRMRDFDRTYARSLKRWEDR